MKNIYTLEYREYGEKIIIKIEAKEFFDAERQAKEYCKENLIAVAWLMNEFGKGLLI